MTSSQKRSSNKSLKISTDNQKIKKSRTAKRNNQTMISLGLTLVLISIIFKVILHLTYGKDFGDIRNTKLYKFLYNKIIKSNH